MAKLSVSKVTIQTASDGGAIVTAGAASHTFENGLDALDFARDALGYPEPKPAYDPIAAVLDQMARAEICQMTEDAKKPMTATECLNRKPEAYWQKPLTPAGLAEKKRQEKNRKQRERSAKKRAEAKRKK